MLNINLFQYLAAFVTIVLAIAVSDLIMSTHRLIVARRRVRWAVLPLAVAVYVFLMVLSEFFSLWHDANVKDVSFFHLVLLVVVPALAALAALAALPDTVPDDGLDLHAYYLEHRVYLFATLALGLIGALFRLGYEETLRIGHLPDLGDPQWLVFEVLTLVNVAIYAALAFVRDGRLQALALVATYALVLQNFAGLKIV